jgi:hypothetical protein
MRFFSPCLRAALFLAAIAALAPARTAHASIVIELDLPGLVQRSDRIAVVDVVSVKSAWDDGHQRIYTSTVLQVVESWKGSPGAGERITLVQPGGTVGDISMMVIGTSSFSPGERSLVFLRGSVARSQVVGLAQGKRPLRLDGATGRWLVAPSDLRSTQLVRQQFPETPRVPASPQSPASPGGPTAGPASTPAVPRSPLAREVVLDDFRTEVQRLVRAATP